MGNLYTLLSHLWKTKCYETTLTGAVTRKRNHIRSGESWSSAFFRIWKCIRDGKIRSLYCNTTSLIRDEHKLFCPIL